MDVPRLLIEAREAAHLTQVALGEAAGTSGAAVCAYERGARSPSVRTLNRLLAAAGKQLRCTLEPLLVDVDQRVDEMLASEPEVDLEMLNRVVERFEAAGELGWAFDGATALALHGFGVSDDGCPGIVLVLDEAARHWLTRRFVKGTGPTWPVGWHSVDREEAQLAIGELALCPFGFARLRLVETLPPVVNLTPPGGERGLPVLGVAEVEAAHAALAELLGRWRERVGRTVVR